MCSTLVPEKYEVEIREISNAANRFLTNLCKQLEKEHSLKMISYIAINVDENIKKELKNDRENKIQYIFKSKKILGSIFSMLRTTWKELKNCDYAVTYNVVYAWMLTPVLAKMRRKKSVLILADYSPIESYSGMKQRFYARIQQYFIGKYDYVIGLSEKTKKYLKKQQKFMCMEGGIADSFYNYFGEYKTPMQEKITFMYSGILEKVTGIDMLIEAFSKVNMENVQLVITGDGSLADWVREMEKKYSQIHYLGCIPYEDYMKKLLKADILINPRNMNLPENANNFPSKIMEYLATGKMIISTKFPGWERYQKYITFCESDLNALERTIHQCSLNALDWSTQRYYNNREFAKKFIWKEQVKAIINFLL